MATFGASPQRAPAAVASADPVGGGGHRPLGEEYFDWHDEPPNLISITILAAFVFVVAPIGLLLIVLNAVKLWTVCWLSTRTDLTLRVSGIGTFLLTVLLVTIMTWPARAAQRYAQRDRAPDPPQATPADPLGAAGPN